MWWRGLRSWMILAANLFWTKGLRAPGRVCHGKQVLRDCSDEEWLWLFLWWETSGLATLPWLAVPLLILKGVRLFFHGATTCRMSHTSGAMWSRQLVLLSQWQQISRIRLIDKTVFQTLSVSLLKPLNCVIYVQVTCFLPLLWSSIFTNNCVKLIYASTL